MESNCFGGSANNGNVQEEIKLDGNLFLEKK